jgi:aldose 1-epimerase
MRHMQSVLLPFALSSCLVIFGAALSLGQAPSSEPSPNKTIADRTAPSSASPLTQKTKMNIEKELFGKLANGDQVDLYTLTNVNGIKVKIMTYGATIIGVETPDRLGKTANITLHLDTFDDYAKGHPCFGSTIGRYGNRIAKGKFTLDGKQYTLATNDKENHLHGGRQGFDKKNWKAQPNQTADEVGITFSYTSPDGEEGYPGELSANVTYSLTNQNELKMEYSATTDKPTIINLTNHTYWTLAGVRSGDALDQVVMINADGYIPVDGTLIPLGEIATVKGTPMDFVSKPMTIGSRIAEVKGGYDHCYVLNKKPGEKLSLAAKVVDPKSGRVMEIYTDQPGFQFYSGNFLDGTISVSGVTYVKNAAFCLETQHYPDSPNQPKFPSTVLRPGQTYTHRTMHKFSVN